jgi:hypothetical protein
MLRPPCREASVVSRRLIQAGSCDMACIWRPFNVSSSTSFLMCLLVPKHLQQPPSWYHIRMHKAHARTVTDSHGGLRPKDSAVKACAKATQIRSRHHRRPRPSPPRAHAVRRPHDARLSAKLAEQKQSLPLRTLRQPLSPPSFSSSVDIMNKAVKPELRNTREGRTKKVYSRHVRDDVCKDAKQ